MSQFNFDAKIRTDLGTGASRRLRRENKFIPAVLYGGEEAAQSIALDQREFYRMLELDEAIYTSVLNINLDGKKVQVIMKDLQRHPYINATVLHIDFLRVDNKTKINILVPIVLENEEQCVGVRNEGGLLLRQMNEVEISAFPQDLPDNLVLDVAELGLGQTLSLSDIKLPKGVEIVALNQDQDNGVVGVQAPRGGSDEDAGEETSEDGEEKAAE